jgi:3-oxoacyl-[acyl-carrier protein] reductase
MLMPMSNEEATSAADPNAAPLAGRRALVTGGSRGIGREIALALAAEGADVALTYRERVDEASAVCRDLAAMGRRALSIQADVSNREDLSRLVTSVHDELGSIDILVNNAGIAVPIPLDRLTPADWDQALATNLTSAFLLTQACLPDMRARQWGRLIFLSSVAAHVGGVVGPHYAASKSGLYGMMHYYAAHLAKEGVTSNAIAPALIETEMVTKNPNAKPGLIPVGRFGRSNEVASLVVLLADNGYITGQTLHVNGGWFQT